MKWKEKGLGDKRVVRIDFSTDENYQKKLRQLAVSCGFKYLTLGSILVTSLLDNEKFVYMIQRHHNTQLHYWVTPKEENGKVVYEMENRTLEERTLKPFVSKYLDFKRDKRLKLSFTNEYNAKLSMLSTSCNMKSKAELIALLVHFALDDQLILYQLQETYNKNRHYWVIPICENGIISYLLG